jgi:exodeoxyribonuclease VII large subunit
MTIKLQADSQKLDYLTRRLISPLQLLQNQSTQLKQLQSRLAYGIQQQLQKKQHTYLQLKSSIENLSPQAVLARGYAIVSQSELLITNSSQVELSQEVNIRFNIGEANAIITNKR